MTDLNKAEGHSAWKELECSEAETEASIEWWREMRRRRHEHDGAVAWYEECAPQQGPSQYQGRI